MIEAWQIEHRPWLYFFLRRFELCRYVLRKKSFHLEARLSARVRALCLVLSGHETEICCFCGGKVGMVWWCDDDKLWAEVTGYREGGGICCVGCFEDRATSKEIFLQWSVALHEVKNS